MGNMMNAAHALGVESCWIHRAKEMFETEVGKALLKELKIEGEYEGIGNLIVGYPEIVPEASKRRENTIFYIK
jgi:nitroreductase